MKYLILGLGAVGSSFLNILNKEGMFIPNDFYAVDKSSSALDVFLKFNGLKDHFINMSVNKYNYLDLLKLLDDGDYFLDFSIDIKNIDLLTYCLVHNIHYLSCADSSWNPDPTWTSSHQHFLEYLNIKEEYKKYKTTSIIEFGMNPGMVSIFTKKCIEDIINNDKSLYIKLHRNKLKELIRVNDYKKVSKMLKIEYIEEVDNDNQVFNIDIKDNYIYSPWSPYAYYYESSSFPEIAVGNKKLYYSFKHPYDCDSNRLYLSLNESGYLHKRVSLSPQGEMNGFIITHEEIYSIREYLGNNKHYPTVFFNYSPCEIAKVSLIDNAKKLDRKYEILTKDKLISGGESVGVLVNGKRFKSRYYGNYLDSKNLDETATVLQVSASAYAAFMYIKNHPDLGFLFPEELDNEEMLNSAKKYLKKYLSYEVKKI